MKTGDPSVHVFVSCAPDDESYLDEFDRHLAALVRKGVISLWHPAVGAHLRGEQAEQERKQALERASLMLLFESRDYFAHPACLDEMQAAIARAGKEGAGTLRLVRVGLRACDVPGALSPFVCIPHRGEPIYHWTSHGDFWNAVMSDLRLMLEAPNPS